MKEDSGAIGLTENTAELTCWMICGPEIARIVNKFEENMPSCRGSKTIRIIHLKKINRCLTNINRCLTDISQF